MQRLVRTGVQAGKFDNFYREEVGAAGFTYGDFVFFLAARPRTTSQSSIAGALAILASRLQQQDCAPMQS